MNRDLRGGLRISWFHLKRDPLYVNSGTYANYSNVTKEKGNNSRAEYGL
jgi:hypothetical protein